MAKTLKPDGEEERRQGEKGRSGEGPHLTLVGELGGADVQLLVLLSELAEVGLQTGVLQPAAVQLALGALVVQGERLVLPEQLAIRRVQPAGGNTARE